MQEYYTENKNEIARTSFTYSKHNNQPCIPHSRIDVRQPHFLLCGSCYWCASYFHDERTTIKCPSCQSDRLESFPISNGEIYKSTMLKEVLRSSSKKMINDALLRGIHHDDALSDVASSYPP
jgi:hypothetical protein